MAGFEKIANVGVSKNDPNYVAYKEFSLNHPKLAKTLEGTELKRFSITGRSGVDENAFHSAVGRVLSAAKLSGRKVVSNKMDTLKDLLNAAAETQLEEKVVIIGSEQSSILCINCKTEDLSSFFKLTVTLKVGMIISLSLI